MDSGAQPSGAVKSFRLASAVLTKVDSNAQADQIRARLASAEPETELSNAKARVDEEGFPDAGSEADERTMQSAF
jgi:hypothetical protein